MKIETDRAEIVAGVRHSQTIGSPIAILIRNKDWQNWTEALPVEDIDGAEDKRKPVTPPASRPCRSGGRDQVQFSRCALYSGARQRAGDHRAGGGGGAGQGAAAGIRHRGAEPRDRGGPGAAGARRRMGRTAALSRKRRSAAGLRGCRSGSAHERSGGRGLPYRRHGGRRVRGGGARGSGGTGVAHRLGYAAGRAAGAGHRFDAGGEGRGGRVRRRGRGEFRLEGAGHDPLRPGRARASPAAPTAPAAWKAA